MGSLSFLFGIVGLLTASSHSMKPFHAMDQQQVAGSNPDPSGNLQRAMEYIADVEAARVPDGSRSTESLSLESQPKDGGKDAPFPGPADDATKDSGYGGSQVDLAGVKRRWGDASLQLWGKRDFEGMRGVERSGNGSLPDIREDGQQLEDDQDGEETQDESSSSSDSNRASPPLGGTPQRLDSKGDEATKRKWGDNSMSVWGKRNAYGKRKWGDNAVTSWGKRDDESVEQSENRKWGDNSMTVWGKRNSHDKRKWGDNSLTAWGKRQSDNKRKWGDNSMSIWGKRLSDDKRKWGDNSMSIWGKRQAADKRKWGDNSLTAWGKRQGDDKRKWGDNSLTAWGKRQGDEKRKWGDNSMSIWGKRLSDDKRKWGDNSMSIWGKREADDKRKWGDNSMSIWGKREADDKRKWGDNSMTVWGKREADDKRKWGDNSMSIWGKREDVNEDQLVKRKWGDNSMTVWGKKRANVGAGPADDPTNAAVHSWLRRHSEGNMMLPFRAGHEEIHPGSDRVPLNGNILFMKEPAVAGTHQTTVKDTSLSSSSSSSTVDSLASFHPDQSDQQRPPTTGSRDSESTSPNRRSIAKRSVFAPPDVLSGSTSWPKRNRERGWRFWGPYVNPYGGPKRNWETNTMKVWGKKRDDDDEKEAAEEYTDWATTSAARNDGIWKRIWTSDNSLRVWGR